MGVTSLAQIYITDNKAKIGIQKGRIVINQTKNLTRSIPIENVEGITIIGNGQITTSCLGECLKRGIAVQYYSSKGFYFGKVSSTQHVNTNRQRKQIKLTEDQAFSLRLSKNILKAKLNNQIVVLRRYQRTSFSNVEEEIKQMAILKSKLIYANSAFEVLGYEGNGARLYFKGLSKLIENPNFKFKGRTRRPPRDPFNSMLSLGYTIIMNDIYGAIEGRGLNPYFAFIHQDREKHPTLASDLMEEWRAIIVDSMAMSLVNGNEIDISHFYKNKETQGVYFIDDGLKIFIKKLEKKMETSTKYLEYINYSTTFRRAIDMQIMQLCKAIEEENPELYYPIKIR